MSSETSGLAPGSAGSAAERAEMAYAWRVLSVTGLGMTVCFLNTSMLPVALPDMITDLDAGPLASSWYLLAYQMVLAALMLPMGRVSDMLGRRTMYVGGLSLVAVSAVAITVASSPGLIIGFRAIQGLGAAAVVVNTTALLVDAFPAAMASIGIGWNITIMSTAIAVGPLLGGLVTEAIGWRGVFGITIPLALAGSVWSAMTLRTEWARASGLLRRFDYSGAVTSAIALGGLVFAVSNAGAQGWDSAGVRIALVAAVVALVCFAWVEGRVRYPVLDFQLLRLRFRACAYGSTALLNIGQSSIALIVSLYLQSATGLSAVAAGLHITALAAGNVVTATAAGKLATRVETRMIASAGIAVALLAMAGLGVAFGTAAPSWLVALLLFVLGVGNGFFVTPNAAAINVGVAPDERGMANGFRVAIDQSALLVSSALAFLLLTWGLPSAAKTDAIGGHLERLSGRQVDAFVDAFPLTAAVVCCAMVGALVVSLCRGLTPRVTTAGAAGGRP